jgi:hypothetical protein
MSHEETFALKLQMGINPSAEIEANVLRAMWKQLTLERENAQRTRSSSQPPSVPAYTNQLVV